LGRFYVCLTVSSIILWASLDASEIQSTNKCKNCGKMTIEKAPEHYKLEKENEVSEPGKIK